MKILQVCPDSYVPVGGVSAHVRSISERLSRHHDVTVFATNHKGLEPWNENINGVKVRRFRCIAPSNSYFFTMDMPIEMRRESFEIVHAHGYHTFPLHLSTLAKADRFIVTPHFHGAGHSPFRDALIRLLKPFGKRTMEKADALVAVSDFEKHLILREFGLDDCRVQVIPNGVDYSEFAGLKRQYHDHRSLLYVGYLASFKGVQYLVEVLPKLPNDLILQIVGSGPLKPYLEKRAFELGISNRVKFCSNVPRKVLLQMYADADVFAMLSRYEAYSIVIAEALTAGTPCVVAKTSALSEWVDGKTCFGVDYPINLNLLATCISDVLNSQSEGTSKWTGTKIIDWNDVTNRLERLYT